jgi:hypothetical protein
MAAAIIKNSTLSDFSSMVFDIPSMALEYPPIINAAPQNQGASVAETKLATIIKINEPIIAKVSKSNLGFENNKVSIMTILLVLNFIRTIFANLYLI